MAALNSCTASSVTVTVNGVTFVRVAPRGGLANLAAMA